MSTTLDILRAARELISKPERWTQEVNARNKDGAPVHHGDPSACQWCAVGAICKSSREDHESAAAAADSLHLALSERDLNFAVPGYNGVAGYNDSATHDLVLALFDRAIAAEIASLEKC